MNPRQAERWLAMELLAVLFISGATAARRGQFPGVRVAVAPFVAFGILSLTSQSRTLAKPSAYIGALVALALVVRPLTVTDPHGNQVASTSGAETATGLSSAVTTATTAPRYYTPSADPTGRPS